MSSFPSESQKDLIASSDSFMISPSLRPSMFSIKYLYSIKSNFAILYRGSDRKIVEKILQESKIWGQDLNIFVFVREELLLNGLYNINDWNKMENNFPKYHEVLIEPKDHKSVKM